MSHKGPLCFPSEVSIFRRKTRGTEKNAGRVNMEGVTERCRWDV